MRRLNELQSGKDTCRATTHNDNVVFLSHLIQQSHCITDSPSRQGIRSFVNLIPKNVPNLLDICQLANYNTLMDNNYRNHLGGILRQQRISVPLTLQELASKAGVSASHLGRIERGERFPSAHILRKIAGPLGFEENELFTLAGYLSTQSSLIEEKSPSYTGGQSDPYVARVLSQEPVEIQRAVVGIISMLKSIAKSME